MHDCKLIADSFTLEGEGIPSHRLTTLEITFPRIVLAELNTHRQFCLAGDAELEFDLPAGTKGGKSRRVHRMRLDEFVDKWLHGARRVGANPKRAVDLSWVEDTQEYTSHEIVAELGMASVSNIHRACRDGAFPSAEKRGSGDDRAWYIRGRDVRAWRTSVPEHTRFDMRCKLGGMRIRQLNETTGDIQLASVVNVRESGVKPVFELTAGEYKVAGSADHLIFTPEGYKRLGDLVLGEEIVVRRFGKRETEHLDPARLKRIDGRWRNQWQRTERMRMVVEDPTCRRCHEQPGEEVHHLIPVYQDPSRAFDPTNITLVCASCHDALHKKQGWQGGTYLYGATMRVTDIRLRGEEPTYDLEINGSFPNFLANGVVVHNSRSSASSRAIPVEKQLGRVLDDPFLPVYWGKNQRGMQAEAELTPEQREVATEWWLQARDASVLAARLLAGHDTHMAANHERFAVHKQITNRLLEPWMWHTVIVSATDWDNFFALRCHKDAQPEIRKAAEMMREVMAASVPQVLHPGEWHLPMVKQAVPGEADIDMRDAVAAWGQMDPMADQDNPEWALNMARISAGRCARVSYLTHDGRRDPVADIELCERITASGHMGPSEHPARAFTADEREASHDTAEQLRWMADFAHNEGKIEYAKALRDLANRAWYCGNFAGFRQLRKMIPGEAVFTGGGTS